MLFPVRGKGGVYSVHRIFFGRNHTPQHKKLQNPKPIRSTVEARKLEYHYPHALNLKEKYRESWH